MSFNWTCPYCDRSQVVVDEKFHRIRSRFSVGDTREGAHGLETLVIGCSNADCKRTTVTTDVRPWKIAGGELRPDQQAKAFFSRRIKPEGSSRPQPEYIPRAIREDYAEACLIRDLSPKASATLSRRCLQGMIRDFGAVKAGTLYAEITALAEAVDAGSAPRGISEDSIEALTAIRKIGNIGAHMEANVDTIIDVEPEEAQQLIEVIESLLEDWYVERQKRSERFARTIKAADSKAKQIQDAKASQRVLPPPAIADPE